MYFLSILSIFSVWTEFSSSHGIRAPGNPSGDAVVMVTGGPMAQLLGELVFEISSQGPAPIKDYFSFQITQTEVSVEEFYRKEEDFSTVYLFP